MTTDNDLRKELFATLAQYTRVVDEKISLLKQLSEVTAERDELFKRLADFSWEGLSEREKMVWAAAFGAWRAYSGQEPEHALQTANEAVTALRRAL